MMLPILDYAALDPQRRREALARPAAENQEQLVELVRATIARVRTDGDAAVLDYAARFDGGAPVNLRVPAEEIAAAATTLDERSLQALRRAIDNVRRFHAAQLTAPLRIETSAGVYCERITRPIESVGLYVPGGSAPLPSALIMSAVPAALAGCRRRILCSPGTRNGRIDPVILATAQLCEIEEVFAVGGAQAIAAMAYGTATIPKVDKIFGPGSAWVTAAKQLVAQDPQGAALDLPAGPSEVLVIADESADAAFVATDLLAQAEHDPLSQAILLVTSRAVAERVRSQALEFVKTLSRASILEQSLRRSRILLVPDLATAVSVSNEYAPEHLILHVQQPRASLAHITAAGSIFMGPWSPEPMGDYCSGTNHVLPTYGFARAYSGLSVADFQRRITVQELTPQGLADLGPTASILAGLEGLDAHALAVDVRLQSLSAQATSNDETFGADEATELVRRLARPEILAMRAYEHAHWDPHFERLHANESPWSPSFERAPSDSSSGLPLNRYPEPQPVQLLQSLAALYGVNPDSVLVGRGSDEGIDLLTRAFCTSGTDAVVICPPTFGMYAVAAAAQGLRVIEAPLRADFALDVPRILQAIEHGAKIVWLCSPNNPTGNKMPEPSIERVLAAARGRSLVVIDEAYAEFSSDASWGTRLASYPHMVVLRTLSKAHGLAGSRIGTVIAAAPIISLLRKLIPPYAISASSVAEALHALQPGVLEVTRARVAALLSERARLAEALSHSPAVRKVFASDANFVLIEANDAANLAHRLRDAGLLVRDFSGKGGLSQALRITVGTPEQNTRVIEVAARSELANGSEVATRSASS